MYFIILLFISNYTFKNVFYSNFSTLLSGGAISCLNEYSELFIIEGFFQFCSAKENGGAIYSTCSKNNIEKCCFYECNHQGINGGRGSAVYCVSNVYCNFYDLSTYKCPGYLIQDRLSSLFMIYGSQTTISYNSSLSAHNLATGLYHYICTSSKILYYNCIKHISGSLIGLGIFNFNGNHSNINFINSTSNNGVFHCLDVSTLISNSIFIDCIGKLIYIFSSPGKITLNNCFFNKLMISGTNTLITNSCLINSLITPIPLNFFSTGLCKSSILITNKIIKNMKFQLIFQIIIFI